MIQTKYANAYTEVYEILNCLNEEEYSKIPKELVEVFEENRNFDYEYKINDEQDLSKQPMLKETKAILLNIFKDYLATPEQNQKIKKWLQIDNAYLEKQKKEKNSSNIFKNKTIEERSNKEELNVLLPTKIKKKSIFQKIINRLKRIFRFRGKFDE